ncbi:hypothetical protein E6O75_ATG03563 [Venturia nashicola]|uniref:Uncharacterized protein n=1 Tax=Venturia nashicola TaxID=86259 RepID=A0A4Z1PP80_9PEZI|nr:hypothetical protein E6O75_ATG03563 [Venturia nashicola]
MRSLIHSFLLLTSVKSTTAQLTPSSLQTFPNTLPLEFPFNPIIPAYWTNYPHHLRTPFALSPDKRTAYLAYLSSSKQGIHIQPLSPTTFTALSKTITIPTAVEAGGLVAQNDGFALLTREKFTGAGGPSDGTPVAVLYRYVDGKMAWKTWLGGPDVHPKEGLGSSPDLTGDLVYSEKAGYYGAMFVVKSYGGWNKGHSGDNILYVSKEGKLTNVKGTSTWGCSHNEGIAFEEADAPPFASICAEDHTGIWLNTKTGGMSGTKISNEHVINAGTNSAMGGTSGSYSVLSRFPNTDSYIFSWTSRGATDLTRNTFMPTEVSAKNRTANRNIAMAILKDKYTLAGPAASSKVGSKDGDANVNWVTTGTKIDRSSPHVATLDATTAVITWEEIANPTCVYDAMDCMGAFTGTKFQLVDIQGKKLGAPIVSLNVTVAGDMVNFGDGRVCWPYPDMVWKLEGAAKNSGGWQVIDPKAASKPKPNVGKMSFACLRKLEVVKEGGEGN